MTSHPDLQKFLAAYSKDVQELFHQVRKLIVQCNGATNELIWDNYNALAIAYSDSLELSDAYCHIALYSKHVNLGFNRGAELSSTLKLEGKGKLIRHIKIKSPQDLNQEGLKELITIAITHALSRNPILIENGIKQQSIIKSISDKKRRP